MSQAPSPARLACAGLISLAVGMGFGRFVYTPILPVMAAALHLTKAETGWIASANFAGYLAGALLAAAPGFKGSARRWMLLALFASGLTTLAMAAASTSIAFAAIRFLGGVASAFVLVFASTAVLERLARLGQPQWSALHFAGVGLGIAASAVLVAGLGAAGLDWRMLWAASGALSLLGALAALQLLPPDAAAVPAASRAAAPPPAGRLPAALLAAYGLFGFGYVITATFLMAIVRASPAARNVEPVVWLLVGLAAVPSVWLWTKVSRRIGPLPAYALAALLEAGGVAVSVLQPTAAGVVLASVILGGTFIGMTALGLVAARESGGEPHRALAAMTAVFGVGQIAGPSFAGLVSQKTGDFTLPSLVAAAARVAAAVASLAARRQLAAA